MFVTYLSNEDAQISLHLGHETERIADRGLFLGLSSSWFNHELEELDMGIGGRHSAAPASGASHGLQRRPKRSQWANASSSLTSPNQT